MELFSFVFLACALTGIAFYLRKPALAFAAGGAWIILAVYSYTQSLAEWDIYYALFFLGAGMTLMCALEPAIMREKVSPQEEPPLLSDDDKYTEDVKRFRKETGWRDRRLLANDRRFGLRKDEE